MKTTILSSAVIALLNKLDMKNRKRIADFMIKVMELKPKGVKVNIRYSTMLDFVYFSIYKNDEIVFSGYISLSGNCFSQKIFNSQLAKWKRELKKIE